jgi:hypothetical protein
MGLLLQLNVDTSSAALEVGIAIDTTSDADEAIRRYTASDEVVEDSLTTALRETLVHEGIPFGGSVAREVELHIGIACEDAIDFVESEACFGEQIALTYGEEDLTLEVGDDDRVRADLCLRLHLGLQGLLNDRGSGLLDDHLRLLCGLSLLSGTQSYELLLELAQERVARAIVYDGLLDDRLLLALRASGQDDSIAVRVTALQEEEHQLLEAIETAIAHLRLYLGRSLGCVGIVHATSRCVGHGLLDRCYTTETEGTEEHLQLHQTEVFGREAVGRLLGLLLALRCDTSFGDSTHGTHQIFLREGDERVGRSERLTHALPCALCQGDRANREERESKEEGLHRTHVS